MRAIAVSVLCALAIAAAAAPPFATTTIEQTVVPEQLILDASIEAVSRSTVSSEVSARVEAILFDVDDFVARDAVLVRFRDREPRARLQQAEANLREARAREREARSDFARVAQVFEKKLVAKSDLDQAAAALKAAEARLEATEAAVAGAAEHLEHTVVRAPYSGIVVKRHIEVGEMASVGQPLMEGLSLERLRATVDVPQRYIDAVRERRQARLIVDGAGERAIPAAHLTVFPYADARTRTFRVRVDFPSEQKGLYPGMFAKVAFTIGEQQRLLLPARALVYRGEITGVYVVGEGDRVALRQLRLGRAHADGAVEVLAGLQAGERVALDPIPAGVYLKQQLRAEGR